MCTMATQPIAVCRHFKYGYCRYQDRCNQPHVKDICSDKTCEITKCSRRHPMICRFYESYRMCKFGEYCLYSHELNPHLKVTEEKLKNAEELFKKTSQELKDKINAIEKELKQKVEEINLELVVEKEKNKEMRSKIKLLEEKIPVSSKSASTIRAFPTNSEATPCPPSQCCPSRCCRGYYSPRRDCPGPGGGTKDPALSEALCCVHKN